MGTRYVGCGIRLQQLLQPHHHLGIYLHREDNEQSGVIRKIKPFFVGERSESLIQAFSRIAKEIVQTLPRHDAERKQLRGPERVFHQAMVLVKDLAKVDQFVSIYNDIVKSDLAIIANDKEKKQMPEVHRGERPR